VCVTSATWLWNIGISVQTEPRPIDKGLIFIKETYVLLSGDRWIVAVNIALDDYSSLIHRMRLVLGQIRRNVQTHRNSNLVTLDLHWGEVDRLYRVVMELPRDLDSFTHLLAEDAPIRTTATKPIRSKRGLLDVLGYELKYLFSTADASYVLRLTKVCSELPAFETQVVHSTEQQLSYLRSLDDNTKQND